LANGHPGGHPGFAYAESHSEGNCTGSFLIRKGDWKYLYFSGDEPLLFHLKEDPGEFRNLAGQPQTAAIQQELHAHLTSLVDPDAVTERAFAAQERFRDAMAARMTRDQFRKAIEGRLGKAQARMLANQCYRRRA
jgi:arylsulfatase A-like enzyme